MAWVFLTDTEVYKLKKPVRYPFLDFSTLKKRYQICGEELQLNRRLAANTYKRIQALRANALGQLALDGTGRIVDWLVVMNRLPEESSLERRILGDRLTRREAGHLADILCEFYAIGADGTVSSAEYLAHLEKEHNENRKILLQPAFGLASHVHGPLDRLTLAWPILRREIERRGRNGFLVEGHGDLRPEHVFLARPLQIIDCLEFNRSMRIIDPYDEVNYLGLECGILGAGWVRPFLLRRLSGKLGHPPSIELQALYGVFRALLRARISLLHLAESPVRHQQVWIPNAKRYLAFAERESFSLPCPEAKRSARPHQEV
ncbi:hypothetical protein [Roseibium litorale]|uniref:Aminoglycoside phosphotransferase domain-containing protein n=1 Tax=Roseibium litorale TaxID=2803841 RepID=A0ABR9CPB7_9HYPH|nr:hypothetical protein [Roseibium litorale]MBD8892682.1 hypothetical protein [Roseibium litorale]